MNWKKGSLLLALVFAMGIFLAACGSGNNNDNGNASGDNNATNNNSNSGDVELADDQTFNVNIKEEPPSLNPAKATDTTSAAVLDQIFEGLTRIKDGEPQAAMAEKWDISDDQKTYTFHLRDGIKWSNGDPVTAEDFAYAWKWVLNPDSPDTDYAYQLYPIKGAQDAKENGGSLDDVGITVKDDKTLVVELAQPTAYFLQLTAFHTFYPVDKKVVEGKDKWAVDAGENYVTNGPFTMETWKHKNKIVLKKNNDYWDKDNVHFETINMNMINDENTELQMYKNGELDWAGSPTGSIPLQAIPSLKKEKKLHINSKAGVYYYSFNIEKKPFNNKNIRKAFSLAINRQAIIDNITKGEQQPAMALVPPSIFESSKEGYFKDNDVDKAKELLKKGMDELGIDKLPEIKISYNTDEGHEKIAQAIQEMWKKNLGVDVKLSNSEWKVFLSDMSAGDYQVGRMGWIADFNDSINFLEIFESVGGNNYTNWEDPKYADMLEKSRTMTDPDKRKQQLKDAEEYFIDQAAIAPIYFYTNLWVNQDYVKDVTVSPLGSFNLKWGYIAKH